MKTIVFIEFSIMTKPPSTSHTSNKRSVSATFLRTVSLPYYVPILANASSSMEVTMHLLLFSRNGDASELAAKRLRAAPSPRNPFVSSIAIDGKYVWLSFCKLGVVPWRSTAAR